MDILRTRLFWIAVGTTFLLILLWLIFFRWTPETQIRLKQESLITSIEEGSRSRLSSLLAEDYQDQWDWNREDIVQAFRDLRQHFLVLNLEPLEAETTIEEDAASVSAMIRFQGKGSPVAQMIIAESAKLDSPFLFHWEKQSALPWSWKLVRVENEELRMPAGYRPGKMDEF